MITQVIIDCRCGHMNLVDARPTKEGYRYRGSCFGCDADLIGVEKRKPREKKK